MLPNLFKVSDFPKRYTVGDFPDTTFYHDWGLPYLNWDRPHYTISWGASTISQDAITEIDGEFTMTVLMAGVDEKDIQATYDDATRSVIAKSEKEPKFGVKEKTWYLTKAIDPKSLKAKFKNGVLTVTCKVKTDQLCSDQPVIMMPFNDERHLFFVTKKVIISDKNLENYL
jgi:hypothetical protein